MSPTPVYWSTYATDLSVLSAQLGDAESAAVVLAAEVARLRSELVLAQADRDLAVLRQTVTAKALDAVIASRTIDVAVAAAQRALRALRGPCDAEPLHGEAPCMLHARHDGGHIYASQATARALGVSP